MTHPWEKFHHCPACGTAVPPPRAHPFRCPSCHFTYYFNTASAVAVFIEKPTGEVLFIRRAREPGLGKLALIGGFTDPQETAENACRREILEEVGLHLGPLTYLGSWPNLYHAGGFTVPVLDLFYTAPMLSDSLTLAPDEVSSALWLDPLQVDPAELAFPSMQHALLAYQEKTRSRG
jgi:NAD+ diphosphatase